MNRLQSLRDELNHKARVAKDILDTVAKDGRALTADEQKLYDTAEGEILALQAQIKELQETQDRNERFAKVLTDLSAARPQPSQAQPNLAAAMPVTHGTASPIIPAVARRTGALKAFTGPDAENRAYRSGLWARAVIFNDQQARLKCESYGIMGGALRNAMSEGSDSAGGVLVPEEFSQAIIDLREEYGVFRRECGVMPMGRDTMIVPRRAGGITAYVVGENQAITESEASWNQVRLTAKKLGALARMSTEIAEDAVVSLADGLAREFAYAFALKEDLFGFTGDGTAAMSGVTGLTNIFTAASGLAGAVDAAAGHDTFAEIDVADLSKVMAALPIYAKNGAKWYCSSTAAELVFGRLMATAGGNTMTTLAEKPQRVFLGYPVVESQVLPSSTGDLSDLPMLFFGNLAMAATMGERRGIAVMTSADRYMEYDQIAVRATERLDINVHDYGTATVAGPIVALVGE